MCFAADGAEGHRPSSEPFHDILSGLDLVQGDLCASHLFGILDAEKAAQGHKLFALIIYLLGERAILIRRFTANSVL